MRLLFSRPSQEVGQWWYSWSLLCKRASWRKAVCARRVNAELSPPSACASLTAMPKPLPCMSPLRKAPDDWLLKAACCSAPCCPPGALPDAASGSPSGGAAAKGDSMRAVT